MRSRRSCANSLVTRPSSGQWGRLPFSFDATAYHLCSMAGIHHPGVGGWRFHLQRSMNRLFTQLTPEQSWWRHNFGFNLTNERTHSLSHGLPWAVDVLPEARAQAAAREAAGEYRPADNESVDGRPSGATVFPGTVHCTPMTCSQVVVVHDSACMTGLLLCPDIVFM